MRKRSQSKPNIPDKQYDPENFAAYPAGFSGPFLLIAQSVLGAAFPVLSICLAIMRKIPMRKCVVTQERFPKKDLIRVVRTPEQTIEIDLTGKKNGHGAYISKSLETLALAKKNKALQRALETEIPDEVYQELEAIITNE